MKSHTDPICQKWINERVKTLLRLADRMGEKSPMYKPVMLRAIHIMDLVDAWQIDQEKQNG